MEIPTFLSIQASLPLSLRFRYIIYNWYTVDTSFTTTNHVAPTLLCVITSLKRLRSCYIKELSQSHQSYFEIIETSKTKGTMWMKYSSEESLNMYDKGNIKLWEYFCTAQMDLKPC